MTEVTARELKNRTGEVLRAVRSGARVVVTNRGRRIAVIAPADASDLETALPGASMEEAWGEIEQALRRSSPKFRTWRDALQASRGRP